MRRTLAFLLLLLAPVAESAGSPLFPVHADTGFEGRVIDAHTGDPIDDAVVVADWVTYDMVGGFLHGSPRPERRCSLQVSETVTDRHGQFRIPGWGPSLSTDAIDDQAPQVYVFKQGYRLYRSPLDLDRTPEDENEDFGDDPIALVPFEGSAEAYVETFDTALTDTLLLPRACEDRCQWEKLPEFTRRIALLVRYFRSHGVRTDDFKVRLYPAETRRFQERLYQEGECCAPRLTLGVTPFQEPPPPVLAFTADGDSYWMDQARSTPVHDGPDELAKTCELPRVEPDEPPPPAYDVPTAKDMPAPKNRERGTTISPQVITPPTVDQGAD